MLDVRTDRLHKAIEHKMNIEKLVHLVPKHFDDIQYNLRWAMDIDTDVLLSIFSNDKSTPHKSHK